MKAAIALLLALALGSAGLACGKYGKPVRSSGSSDRIRAESAPEPERAQENERPQ